MTVMTTVSLISLRLLLIIQQQDSVVSPRDVLRSCKSPSGAYCLTILPAGEFGCGGAAYRLSKDDKVVWEGVKDYTLYCARVTDDGVTAGYTYTQGLEGKIAGGQRIDPGDFVVAIFDVAGNAILQERVARQPRIVAHHSEDTAPNPFAEGEPVIDVENDRFIVRVAEYLECGEKYRLAGENWWVYRLSTGERIDAFRPRMLMPHPDRAFHIYRAVPVKGTPLILLQWAYKTRHEDHSPTDWGLQFALFDGDARVIWTLERPKDEDWEGSKYTVEEVRWIKDHGAILSTDEPKRFDLWFIGDKKRVTFVVEGEAGGKWLVKEVARTDYDLIAVEPPPATSQRSRRTR